MKACLTRSTSSSRLLGRPITFLSFLITSLSQLLPSPLTAFVIMLSRTILVMGSNVTHCAEDTVLIVQNTCSKLMFVTVGMSVEQFQFATTM
jgi:hypothetical protein